MPPLGTAPRKINGVWYTRTGRRLSDAGQRYWEGEHRAGRADAQGHYTPKAAKTAGVGAAAGAQVTVPKPRKPTPHEVALAQAAATGQADRTRPDVQAAVKTTRTYNKAGKAIGFKGALKAVGRGALAIEMAPTNAILSHTERTDQQAALAQLKASQPFRTRRAAQVNQAYAKGRITREQAMRQIRQLNPSKAELVPSIGGGIAGRFVQDLIDTALYTPASAKYTLEHPIAAGKAMVKTSAQSLTPKGARAHPGIAFLTAWGAKSVLGGGLGRGHAIVDVARGVAPKSIYEAMGAIPKADKFAVGVLTRPAERLGKMSEATLERIRNPSPALQAFLEHDKKAASIRDQILKKHAEGEIVPLPNKPTQAPGRAIRAAASTKSARIAQAAIRTPKPKERVLVYKGPNGKTIPVTRVGSRDYLTNLFQRKVMDKAAQAKLDKAGIIPAGHAVAEHIHMNVAEHGQEVASGINAMNAVHGAKPLDRRVTVLHEPRMEDALGVHIQRRQGEPYLIQVNPKPGQVAETTVHEAGHALQHMVQGADKHVLDAIKQSHGYQQMRNLLPKGTGLRAYFTKDAELWARAYSQYIATKTGHAEMHAARAAYDKQLTDMGLPPVHWSPEDFKPIEKAFDEAFQGLGWQTKGGQPVVHSGRGFMPTRVEKYLSPEATIGREARAARQVQDAAEIALASRLERFGRTRPAKVVSAVSGGRYGKGAIRRGAHRTRLTVAEQKALDIRSSGATPAEHIAYHEEKLRELAQEKAALPAIPRGPYLEHKVSEAKRIRREEQQHQAQIGAIKAAQVALDKPRPIFQQALVETSRAMTGRERMLTRAGQLTKSDILHRIGARQGEIQSIAEGTRIREDLAAGIITKAEAKQQLIDAGIALGPGGRLLSPLQQLPALERQITRTSDQLQALKAVQEQQQASHAARFTGEASQIDQAVADLEARLQALVDRQNGIHQTMIERGALAREHGAFYLPSKSLRDLRRSPVGAGRAPSDYGVAPPRVLPELTHAYTGALQRTGNFRIDATGLAGASYRRAQRWAAVDRAYQMLMKSSHGTKESAGPFAIPIREKITVPKALKEIQLRADAGDLTRSDLVGAHDQMEAFVKEMLPDPRQYTANTIPGVRWIDGRIAMGFQAEFNYGGKLAQGVESFNAPFRASILYTKPAYALNLLQNIGTNVIRQGVFTPVNITRALALGRELGAVDQHALLSLVGEGLSRSLEAESGIGKMAIHGAGEWWNKVVDRYPRAAALLHEMRTMGFNTPDKIHALLNDPRYQPMLTEVARRANKEAVEYGQLTPFERNVVKRAIFFYPWLRGSTLYTLRFPREHPITAAVAANAAQYGKEQNLQKLGPGPSYMEGAFPVKLPGQPEGLTNLANVNTWATPAEITQGVRGLFQPSKFPFAGDLAQNWSPAMAALYTLVSGKTTLGNELPGGKSRMQGALEQLVGSLPEVAIARRLNTGGPQQTNPAKQPIYQPGGHTAVGKYLFGGAYPAPFNRAAYNARGVQELKTQLKPGQKVLYGAKTVYDEFVSQAQNAGVLKKGQDLPPDLRNALRAQTMRYSFYASMGIKHTQPDYQQKAFQADIKLLRRKKMIPPAEASRALTWSETAPVDDLKSMRSYLGREYFLTGTTSQFRSDLHKRGFPVDTRITPP